MVEFVAGSSPSRSRELMEGFPVSSVPSPNEDDKIAAKELEKSLKIVGIDIRGATLIETVAAFSVVMTKFVETPSPPKELQRLMAQCGDGVKEDDVMAFLRLSVEPLSLVSNKSRDQPLLELIAGAKAAAERKPEIDAMEALSKVVLDMLITKQGIPENGNTHRVRLAVSHTVHRFHESGLLHIKVPSLSTPPKPKSRELPPPPPRQLPKGHMDVILLLFETLCEQRAAHGPPGILGTIARGGMGHRQPGFNPKTYGFSKFRNLIDLAEQVCPDIHTLVPEEGDLQIWVEPAAVGRPMRIWNGETITPASSSSLSSSSASSSSSSSSSSSKRSPAAGRGRVEEFDRKNADHLYCERILFAGLDRRSQAKHSKGVLDTSLKDAMIEVDSEFDEKTRGFSKFRRFLDAYANADGLIQIRVEKGRYFIRDMRPKSSASPTPPGIVKVVLDREKIVPPTSLPEGMTLEVYHFIHAINHGLSSLSQHASVPLQPTLHATTHYMSMYASSNFLVRSVIDTAEISTADESTHILNDVRVLVDLGICDIVEGAGDRGVVQVDTTIRLAVPPFYKQFLFLQRPSKATLAKVEAIRMHTGIELLRLSGYNHTDREAIKGLEYLIGPEAASETCFHVNRAISCATTPVPTPPPDVYPTVASAAAAAAAAAAGGGGGEGRGGGGEGGWGEGGWGEGRGVRLRVEPAPEAPVFDPIKHKEEYDVILEALRLGNHVSEDTACPGAALKLSCKRIQPLFDEKSIGFKKFKDLVIAINNKTPNIAIRIREKADMLVWLHQQ